MDEGVIILKKKLEMTGSRERRNEDSLVFVRMRGYQSKK